MTLANVLLLPSIAADNAPPVTTFFLRLETATTEYLLLESGSRIMLE